MGVRLRGASRGGSDLGECGAQRVSIKGAVDKLGENRGCRSIRPGGEGFSGVLAGGAAE